MVGTALAAIGVWLSGWYRIPVIRKRSSRPWALVGCSRQSDIPDDRYPVPACDGIAA
jgi:hypothetical protein